MPRKSKKIGILDVSAEISAMFATYGQVVNEVVDDAMRTVADEATEELKRVNYFSPKGNPTGEYSKDWVLDVEPVRRYSRKFVVHNEDHYRLTHLLESGHSKWLWGRDTGAKVQGYPHIKPINDKAQKRVIEEIVERVVDIK